MSKDKRLEAALKILNVLNEAGYEAYLVGGFVRDHLLGIESKDIDYKILTYDEAITNGVEVSNILGLDSLSVFKTLVTVNEKKEHFVFMIPVGATLDLKKASVVTGSKYIEMIKEKELLPLTGYVHGGCSPIGMKKQFPTFIDSIVEASEYIYFSGGKKGVQVTMKFTDLERLVNIKVCDLTL